MSAEPEHDSQLLSVEPSSSEESFYDSEPTEYCQNLVEIERLTGLFDPGPATSVLDYAREVQFAVRYCTFCSPVYAQDGRIALQYLKVYILALHMLVSGSDTE